MTLIALITLMKTNLLQVSVISGISVISGKTI